jgi:hypothetical protein
MYRVGRTNKQAKRIIITKDTPPPPPNKVFNYWTGVGAASLSLSVPLPLPTSPHTSIQVSPKFRFDKNNFFPKRTYPSNKVLHTNNAPFPSSAGQLRANRPLRYCHGVVRPSTHQYKFGLNSNLTKNELLSEVNLSFEPSPLHKRFTHPLIGRVTQGQLQASWP